MEKPEKPSDDPCRMKILYVEDDAGLRGMVGKMIMEQFDNASVVFAEDGIDGLIKIGQHEPDLIISDLYMPHLSGFNFCENVLRLKQDSNIIVISACSKREVIEQCLSIGIKRYISKPFHFPELMDSIQEIMVSVLLGRILKQKDVRAGSTTIAKHRCSESTFM